MDASHHVNVRSDVYALGMNTDPAPSIHITPAQPDHIEIAARIYQASAEDLHARLRSSNPWDNLTARHEDFQQAVRTLTILQRNDSHALFIARDDAGEAVGMAAVMVQEPHAHLAFLFVEPELQNKGVGRELLAKVQQHVQGSGATVLTLASSRDPKAWQRYLRLGLRPGPPQLPFRANHPLFPRSIPEHRRLSHRLLVANDLEAIAAIDLQVRGAERRGRLLAWLSEGSTGRVAVDRKSGEVVGYGMVSIDDLCGQIGPVVATQVEDFPFVLDIAMLAANAVPNPESLPWRADGSSRNHVAIDPLLAAGFSVESLVNWFETRPIGLWDRYLYRDEDEL